MSSARRGGISALRGALTKLQLAAQQFGDSLNNTPLYGYDTLPDASTHIRLLHVPRYQGQPYRLTTHELTTGCPPYVALSYTWEAPLRCLSPEEKAEYAEIHSCAIAIRQTENAHHRTFMPRMSKLWVRKNLYEALPHIRQQINAHASQNGGQRCLLWVDSVSINQADAAEKAAQVAAMGRIFGGCETVLVWLGREDEMARRFVRFHEKIITAVRALEEREGVECLKDRATWTLARLQHVLRIDVSHGEWDAYCGFFEQRAWFHRAWIVQEVALALEVVFVCGELRLGWDAMSNVETFLSSTALEGEVLGQRQIDRNWAPKQEFSRITYMRQLFEGQARLCDSTTPIAARLRADLKSRTGAQTEKQLYYAFLMEFLIRIRPSESSSGAEKVHAVLGLLNKYDDTVAMHALLRPDMSLDTEEVFRRVTQLLLEHLPYLTILTMVEEPKDRKLKKLPSWVPDFTVLAGDDSIQGLARDTRFNASKAPAGIFSHRTVDGGKLELDGASLDLIVGAADPLEAGLNKNVALTAAAAFIISNVHLVSEAIKMRPREVSTPALLWETLTAGTHQDYGAEVAQQHCLDFLLGAVASYETEIGHDHLFHGLEEATTCLIGLSNRVEFDARRASINHAFQHHDETHLQDDGSVSFFWTVYRRLSLRHRLFRTSQGHLGLGPVSLQPGDDVFVLEGAPVFFILHACTTATASAYTLVGDAYVHSLMQGQAKDLALVAVAQRITLV